jgi:hypothetical protein
MKSALEHGLDPSGHRGKHTGLEQNRERQILDRIKQNAEGSPPVTKKEIKYYSTSEFQVPITCGRVNSFVRSSIPGQNHSSKAFPRGRAALASTASVPRTNSAESQ